MSPTCAHLHVHSEYSLLDGANKIDALAERAAAFDQPALALTDHGRMNGAVELYQAARKHGIKPIQGCEVYVTNNRREKGKRHHLTLIAETPEGYRNLVKLCSAGFLEGLQRGYPTVDAELLARYATGIIALTGCLASKFCSALVEGRVDAARGTADELIQIFGPEQVYFEIQQNGIPEQEKANAGIIALAREFGRPLVGTGDVHYLRREDFDNHAALLCVQTKSTLANPKLAFSTNEFYLHSSEEMADKFSPWPEALASTLEIAERCDVEIELGKQLIPTFPCPDGLVEAGYLRRLVEEGLAHRYGDPVPAAARERAEYELGVIDRMGYSGYFLIVWDFINWARSNGISVGPGRGSAAGSIVAYSTGITDLDPLAYDLLFERFLNPERVSMPDIDVDFSVRGRERVIQYVTEKYGKESVAQIITFGRMFPRAATKDAARVLGFPYALGDKLAKLIPDPEQGRAPKFADCLADGQPLALEVARDPEAAKVIEVARGLEGIVRNASIHAAAVVIAPRPLTDLVPVELADTRSTDANGDKVYRTVTQFSMKPVEAMGLLKMDFLGLRNLDVIEDALDIIERSTGGRPDMRNLALDDVRTYEMLARGESIGVFQFESEGFREALKKVRPTEFDDLIALGALYRPGAMDSIPTYARGKHDPASIDYRDDRLIPILESTKGVIIYQEQAMLIAQELGGFSGAKADDLRKAIGKKNREAMAKLKPEFVDGCRASGTADSVIDWLWTTNEKSADYSFNKSHAACYALISYRTAWLRANYPAEYMAALISSVMDTKDKVPFFVSQAEQMGIDILPPDVNLSDHNFVVVDSQIRFGLDAVKGVGYAAVEAIKAARGEIDPVTGRPLTPFRDIYDFCERIDSRSVNRKAIESLIKCGAFGSTQDSRKGMLLVLEQAQAAGQQAQQDQERGQASIFDLLGEAEAAPVTGGGVAHAPVPAGEFEPSELLAMEKESIGLFISTHPLKAIAATLEAEIDYRLAELDGVPDQERVIAGGIISATKRIKTKKGDWMMFATLEDLSASVEMVIFGDTLAECEEILSPDVIVLVKGKVDHKDAGRTCLVVNHVERFAPTAEEVAAAEAAAADRPVAPATVPFRLRLAAGALTASTITDLRDVLVNFPGESEVLLDLVTRRGTRTLRLGAGYRVTRHDASLHAELDRLLGGALLGPDDGDAAAVDARAA
ncbi:DNA polymerase III subunit alpha [Conexibacter sp. DBS9H8]|uniref:DNA polymerase III subunit alpha n=1 Tax=Conexibacter sp. DBS9H8 TaxID=2937801 RepID=UPI00200E442E|nr:DNA polymerase III subunit alpha [Conexibacter sp. DBS9H8]